MRVLVGGVFLFLALAHDCAGVVEPEAPMLPVPVSKPMGQVAGVAVDPIEGTLVAFHRGDRIWNEDSFTPDFRFQEGPIANATLFVIDPDTGVVLGEHGAHQFLLPHSISADRAGNYWLTDVARHQVIRMDRNFTPTLVLGEHMVPGDDDTHFCQPTDVAVAADGTFFVSDGYCNSRILKFAPNGTLVGQFGGANEAFELPAPAGAFLVPHSLALIEDLNLLCVADRENQRIQCFSAGLRHDHRQAAPFGAFVTKAEDVGRVYGIREKRHYLVGVTGADEAGLEPQLFVMDMESGKANSFAQGLDGHALAVDDTGSVFVARTSSNDILRLQL